jgi:hypothetical protein
MNTKWKNRFELPVIKKLNIEFDIDRLKLELEQFSKNKIWDGLGSEYASLCENHTKLPKMFFKDAELENITCISDLNWPDASYQQLSLTEFDNTFNLDQRTEKSNTAWDDRIAKHNYEADERWFKKIKSDVPPYMKEILEQFDGKAHRARFANLSAKSSVKPHIDYDTTYGIRLHIAVNTNDQCYNGGWDKDGNEIKFHIPADGSVWFINPGVKHYAINNGDSDRNHLIISVDSQLILSQYE